MPLIDDKLVDTIKQQADIADVVGEFVSLDYACNKNDRRYLHALCPFHDDRHLGSFVIDTQKQRCTCYPCNKSWDAVAFLMDLEGMTYPEALRWLANRYGIPMDGTPYTPDPNKVRKVAPPKQRLLRTWPKQWVNDYREKGNDTFCQWVRSLPWDESQRARVETVLNNYLVGHSRFEDETDWGRKETHDFVMFWMVDDCGVVHNAHFMKYYADGHRVKDKRLYPTTWLHARMRRAQGELRFDDNIHRESYCLFGLHLLHLYPNATVNIVESEKTAIIASIAYNNPHYSLWMATTGLKRLTKESLAPIIKAGRSIVLWPDHDGIEAWTEVAKGIGYSRMMVNADAMTKWWRPSDGEKADIADIILNRLREGNKPQLTPSEMAAEWAANNPGLDAMIKQFKLKATSITTTDGKLFKESQAEGREISDAPD